MNSSFITSGPGVLFDGQRQIVQAQIKRHFAYRMLYLNLNKTHHLTSLKTEMDWSNWYDWDILFGLNE